MCEIRQGLLAVAAFVLAACSQQDRAGTAIVATAGGLNRDAGEFQSLRWQQRAAELLLSPTRVALPYADSGTFHAYEGTGHAYVFSALEGQQLEIELGRAPTGASDYDDGPILVDLFRVRRPGAGDPLIRVKGIRLAPGRLTVKLPRSGDYVFRIQPTELVNTHFGLSIELSAAIEFPVLGSDLAAVDSVFGDERDGGIRAHEGIDIFAPRLTPVVAVADGRAVPKRNNLGGIVVFLNTPGVSYYYAHLDRTAMDRPRRVRAGEILGFVGNTGNAVDTPPHLHFGIYDWGRGRGAVNPLPHLQEQRFQNPNEIEPLIHPHRSLSAHRLEPAANGTLVWMSAPAELLSLAPPRGRDWLGSSGPDSTIGGKVTAFVPRWHEGDVVARNDTAALRRGIHGLPQLQYGLRP